LPWVAPGVVWLFALKPGASEMKRYIKTEVTVYTKIWRLPAIGIPISAGEKIVITIF
jgi:hypothetical protein